MTLMLGPICCFDILIEASHTRDIMDDLKQQNSILAAANMAQFIDHTLLKPEVYKNEIYKLCEEAIEFNFFSVCINSSNITFAREILKNSKVKICTVVGFPLGACETSTKTYEVGRAISMGSNEIDMVLNIGALKAGEFSLVKREIEDVVRAADGRVVKVIFETCLLNSELIRKASELSMEANAHFVKTSTGFSTGGATLADVTLMKSVVGSKLQVKASGGIRDYKTALSMIQAGATRLGTSSGVSIVSNAQADESTY